ncbi:hypothetical protein [Fibrobacter sp.]|uniref:hypothetical protein n=1 Tax=Fibrobacter sp. TaxID=35828 RepID=UPI00386EA05D
MIIFAAAMTVFGTISAFWRKSFEVASLSYGMAWFVSMVWVMLDFLETDRVGATTLSTILDTYFMLVVGGMCLLCYKYDMRWKEFLERRSMLYPKMRIEDFNGRRGTLLVWVNRKAGRTPDEVEEFFKPCGHVEVTVLSQYAVVRVKDAENCPDRELDNIRQEIMQLTEFLTKPRDTDKEV